VGGPSQAEGVDRAVQPIVHAPEQARLLRFHVAGAAEVRREQVSPVRHAITVGVRVLPHLVRVRLHREDRVRAEGHHESGKYQVVHEDGVTLEGAVVVAILVPGDPAERRNQIDAAGCLDVSAQLEHEHSPVAVEGDLGGVFDERFREQGLDPVTRRKQQPPGLLGRR
jgi:hypothetical protein